MNRINVAIFNDTNTRTTRHYGCSIVMDNLIQKLIENHINPVYLWPVGKDWRKHKNQIINRSNFSAIIVNGEGSIHHSEKKEKPIYLSEIGKFAKDELDIPAFLINSTISNNTKEVYENLKFFKRIYVRESNTFETLKKYGIKSEIIPDLTFAYSNNVQINKIERNGNLITDSTFTDLRRLLKEKSIELNWEYISMKRSNSRTKISTIFLKFRKFLKNGNFNTLKELVHKTLQINGNLISKIKPNGKANKFDYKKVVDHDWFVNKIRSSEFVVTGRFHTVTICIITQTPFVAIASNTPKISGILYDIFQSTERLISVEELKEISQKIPAKYRTFSKGELKKIDTYIKKSVISIDNMFKDISTEIRKDRFTDLSVDSN